MRRLLLASLAFLLLLLPFQVEGVQASPESCCAACTGMPSCPPRCPTPTSPSPLPPNVIQAVAAPFACEAETARRREPSPAPDASAQRRGETAAAKAAFDAPLATGPPDRRDAQAFLRIFRI